MSNAYQTADTRVWQSMTYNEEQVASRVRGNPQMRHLARSTSGLVRGTAALLCGLLLLVSTAGNRFPLAMVLVALVAVGIAATTVPPSSSSARLASLLEAAL